MPRLRRTAIAAAIAVLGSCAVASVTAAAADPSLIGDLVAPDGLANDFALLDVPGRELRKLNLSEAYPHLAGGCVFLLQNPTGDVSDGVTEFTVERSGRVFLAVTWRIKKSLSKDVQNEAMQQEELQAAGWTGAGELELDQKYTLFARYCTAGESHRIRTTDRIPPLPIVAPPLDLSTGEVLEKVVASNYLLAVQAAELRDRRDIDGLEELATRLRTSRQKFASGHSHLMRFYEAVGVIGLFDADPAWIDRLEFLEDWCAQRPDSPTPHIAAAMLLNAYGWQARGRSIAARLTPQQKQLFQERLARSAEHAQSAAGLPQDDPFAYSVLISSAPGIGTDFGELSDWALAGLKIDPSCIELVEQMGNWLLPQWYGRPGQCHTFGMAAVDATRESQGTAMYAVLLQELTQRTRDKEFLRREFRWEQVRRGFDDFLERNQNAYLHRAGYVHAATLFKDRDAAEAAFNKYCQEFETSGYDIPPRHELARAGLQPGVREGEQQVLIADFSGAVEQIAFSADDKRIVAVEASYALSAWDPSSGKPQVPEFQFADGVRRLLLAGRTGTHIAAGTYKNEIVLRELNRSETAEFAKLGKHDREIIGIGVSEATNQLLTASGDGVIKLWNGQTGKLVKEVRAQHGRQMDGVAFANDGTLLVTAGEDKIVRVWDATSGEQRTEWSLDQRPQCVALSRDAQSAAVGDAEGNVIVFSTADGKLLQQAQVADHRVECLAFSPTGTVLAIGGAGKQIYAGGLWTWRIGPDSPQQLTGHRCAINCVVFANTQPLLASAGHDWTIRLWKVEE